MELLVPFGSFVASNWKDGWVGQFMQGVIFDYLKLTDDNVLAMTVANFTGDTDPDNASSIMSQGLDKSDYQRCVVEIKLGHVVCFKV